MSQAPADLRILAPRAVLTGTGNADSLENVIVDQIPNGAICWVIDQDKPYVLDKFSTAAVSAPSVIATQRGAGSPGRWKLFTGTSGTVYAGNLTVAGLPIGSTATLNVAIASADSGDFAIADMTGNTDDFSVTFFRCFPGNVQFRLRNDSRASTNFDEDISILLFQP
jgi:hypothetical protein